MSDKIELLVEKFSINSFESYSIERDMYLAASAFDFRCYKPAIAPAAGDRCEIKINGDLAMTGIIDKVEKTYGMGGTEVTISGRDLMGLVVDSYCEPPYQAVTGRTLKQIAGDLLSSIPFISRKDIEYADNTATLTPRGKFMQIEPGQTAFDVLHQAAVSRGVIFRCRPDGTFIFSRPKEKGPTAFTLYCKDGENKSRILTGTFSDDISNGYSQVTVMSQQQGEDETDPSEINVRAARSDPDYPFRKPMVETVNEDEESPGRIARTLVEQMRTRRKTISYTVSGHNQNGRVWAVNELCSVDDDVLDLYEDMLVYAVVFRGSKSQGSTTEIRLGKPGVAQ